VIFDVLKAQSIKMPVFWHFAPCTLKEVADVSVVLTASIIQILMTKAEALLKGKSTSTTA
jgi:hypothetical protein